MPEPLPVSDSNVESLRRFAAIKLVIADLDGTVFPSELASTFQRVLRRLNHAQVQFTVGTGRTFRGISALLAHLQDERGKSLIKRGTPFILYNGSVVVEAGTGHLLRRCDMANESFNAVLTAAARHSCELFSYTCEENMMGDNRHRGVVEHVLGWQFKMRNEPQIKVEFNGQTVEWQSSVRKESRICPCAVVIRPASPQELEAIAADAERVRGITITRSGGAYLEVRPQNSSKGIALGWIARHLGYSAGQILAIGDNDNDVEMLESAGIGVAVSTASKAARQHADFMCQFGPFQGAVQVLRLVCEAHRYFRDSGRDHSLVY
jgi:Cof subfamily protein (haloacid dehalogenase superfamily)